jgi:hypothetical protein
MVPEERTLVCVFGRFIAELSFTIASFHTIDTMELSQTIQQSTSVHENLLAALNPEEECEPHADQAFFDWINQNQDG